MTDYPHVPAAFINAIAEEGTKAEAVEYLQEQWNEICALRKILETVRQYLDPDCDPPCETNREIVRLLRAAISG
jgi:hypothetical protein